jgi:hypothetical protein
MIQVSFVGAELGRWDVTQADAISVGIFADQRPLRGPAGLLDWRLCGRLSQMIRQGRLSGSTGEKLLLVTQRVPWQRVLAIGLGESIAFDEGTFRAAADCCLDTLRRIGVSSLAIALPGRDIDLVRPDRALAAFLDALAESERASGPWLGRLTVIDAAAAPRAPAKIPTTSAPSA